MPQVSVIIPTYNRAGRICAAVESVLDQDFRDFELVVVDDGSTDETGSVLSRFQGLKVISQNQKGVSAARNAGVSATTGPLIAFLDSDDLWTRSKLSVQVEFFKNSPDARICQTQEIWIRNGKRVNPGVRHFKQSGFQFERSLELCLVSPSAVMMRRSLFEEHGGFDESLPACEDYDLWLKIGLDHPFHLIDEPHVIKHGGHGDQLSAMPGLDAFRVRSIVNLLENFNLSPVQRTAAVKVLKNKCRIYANGCRKRGRIKEAEFHDALIYRYK